MTFKSHLILLFIWQLDQATIHLTDEAAVRVEFPGANGEFRLTQYQDGHQFAVAHAPAGAGQPGGSAPTYSQSFR
jgi:hypothetical protein